MVVARDRLAPVRPRPRTRQQGALAIEFAMVCLMLVTVLVAIMEFAVWMYTVNAASDATARAARLAVVCAKADSANVVARVQAEFPLTPPVELDYRDAEGVVVARISDTSFARSAPGLIRSLLSIPTLETAVSRESMSSADNPSGCAALP